MVINRTKMEVAMFASFIEMKLRPGKLEAMKGHTESKKIKIQVV